MPADFGGEGASDQGGDAVVDGGIGFAQGSGPEVVVAGERGVAHGVDKGFHALAKSDFHGVGVVAGFVPEPEAVVFVDAFGQGAYVG